MCIVLHARYTRLQAWDRPRWMMRRSDTRITYTAGASVEARAAGDGCVGLYLQYFGAKSPVLYSSYFLGANYTSFRFRNDYGFRMGLRLGFYL